MTSRRLRTTTLILGLALMCPATPRAQTPPPDPVRDHIVARTSQYADLAHRIWQLAEVGYQEVESSALLQRALASEGFAIQRGVAGMPTGFVATWGSGKPVIAILGEFDALPGLSQQAAPERAPLVEGGAGHACGHHLFGVGSLAAAVSIKAWLESERRPGTIRLYGTPAEEGGSGKVYMVRDGLFSDVDAVIAWHPGDRHEVASQSSLANVNAKFRFHGIAAHAAGAPERGRSALDGVEAMNFMVNQLREHVPADTRMHYVITRGGQAANVVPDFAEVYYYARHTDMHVLNDVWTRIIAASEGAARGTGTTVDHEVLGAVWNLLPNETLALVQQRALERVGGYTLSADERAFAAAIQQSLRTSDLPPLDTVERVGPVQLGGAWSASTDVGDVSWVVPTVQLSTATWVPGTPAHSWQAVAAGGMSIGVKGMSVAAQAMALTAQQLFLNPETLRQAHEEFNRRRGPAFIYRTTLGTRAPALDYRK